MTQPLDRPHAYPLQWPSDYLRTSLRQRARFGNHTRHEAMRSLENELRLLDVLATNFIVSSNAGGLSDKEPADPGVAVYFRRGYRSGPLDHVLACDKFDKVQDNLWAVARHIEDLRRGERYGFGAERALTAYRALPQAAPPPPPRPWHEVLRCLPDATEREIRASFTARCEEQHTDAGGTGGDMAELTRARDEGLATSARRLGAGVA